MHTIEVNLIFLSKLNDGDRICIKGDRLDIEARGVLIPLKRYIYGDGRYPTIQFIRNMFITCEDVMDGMDSERGQAYCEALQEIIRDSVAGLESLARTYSGDKRFEAEIEHIRKIVDKLT